MWQLFRDAARRMGGQSLEDVLQVRIEVVPVDARRVDQAHATGFADWSTATERYLQAGAISSTHIDKPKPSGTAFWFDAPPPYQVTWAAVVSGEQLRFISAPAMPSGFRVN